MKKPLLNSTVGDKSVCREYKSINFCFNPLQYDGMPLMSTFGLNSSAHDVYARPDIGFKGVEFVRGGAAVLYGAGSVAGLINYTSKTGDTNPGNVINVEWGSRGRLKTDFYTGGKLGGEDSNTFYAFTGFVRKDDGPIETGLPTRGVQFRGNIKKRFEKGTFTLHGQYIDDKAQFFLPLPLDGDSRERIAGNDGDDVEQLVAIKKVSKVFRELLEAKRLVREIRALSFFNHPNIIKVYGYFDDLLHLYIIMECALDQRLSDILK